MFFCEKLGLVALIAAKPIANPVRVADQEKVKPNMADMKALSYVGFSPPAQFLLYT